MFVPTKIDHISGKTIYPKTIKLILHRPYNLKLINGGGEEKEWAANSTMTLYVTERANPLAFFFANAIF